MLFRSLVPPTAAEGIQSHFLRLQDQVLLSREDTTCWMYRRFNIKVRHYCLNRTVLPMAVILACRPTEKQGWHLWQKRPSPKLMLLLSTLSRMLLNKPSPVSKGSRPLPKNWPSLIVSRPAHNLSSSHVSRDMVTAKSPCE